MTDNHPDIDIVGSVVRLWGLDPLDALLFDRTMRRNIIWADTEYKSLGEGYQPYDEIKIEKITGFRSGVIKTRIMKDAEDQAGRTKRKAEVFTPSWLCNQMNNVFDDEWFGRSGVFNRETDCGWVATSEPVAFSEDRGGTWRDYVDCRKLEITCGEAPFLCSRYDATTGNYIPVENRIGILDRKLRVASENTDEFEEWLKWAYRALESTYGYEYQGDNLIVARINVLMTFAEHMQKNWDRMPTGKEVAHASRIITWNIWQMDGLNGCVPGELTDKDPIPSPQTDIFEILGHEAEDAVTTQAKLPLFGIPCRIYDWRAGKSQTFNSLKA